MESEISVANPPTLIFHYYDSLCAIQIIGFCFCLVKKMHRGWRIDLMKLQWRFILLTIQDRPRHAEKLETRENGQQAPVDIYQLRVLRVGVIC